MARMRRLMAAFVLRTNTYTSLGVLFFYLASSYCLLLLAGEENLIHADNFLYWIMVTASTVGYGDLSPTTTMGKYVVSFWVIPLGLSLFALIITKIGLYLSENLLKYRKGLNMLNNEDHCVIIGWNGSRTLRLIELLRAKTNIHKMNIVLCVDEAMENPLPKMIDFVSVDSFSHKETMSRANLARAKTIIIDTPMDDITLTTALFCEKVSPNSHKTAYFQDEHVGDLLLEHCPNIEVIPGVGVEMLAKSTVDPGSSLLHKQLLDATYGMTQYSIVYPSDKACEFEVLFNDFKKGHQATLIGVKQDGKNHIDLNPNLNSLVNKEDVLYYISQKRLLGSECFTKSK
ncbi:MAG: ion channel [Bermanella sp.]